MAFNQGVVAMGQGDEATALAAWRKALELDPCLIPAALNLITYHQQHNDYAAEVALWDKVLAYDPFDTDHLIFQASAYRRTGELEKAIDNYLRAISIYPYFKFWYHELATIYQQLGETDEAALWRGRGDSLGADEAEICYEDGLRHVGDCRWPSARSCFEAVLDEFPANLDARLRLADVLAEAGTTQEIIQQYRAAMELTDAAKGLVHYRMGEFFFNQGDFDNAERELEAAIASVASYLKAERTLQEVRRRRERALGTSPTAKAPLPQPREATAGNPSERSFEQPANSSAPRPAPPASSERLLRPEDIGLEPLGPSEPSSFGLRIKLPNPRLPWQQQLRQTLDQALSVAAPGGGAPRVAVVLEPDRELAEAVSFTMAELRSTNRGLRTDPAESAILVVRSEYQSANSPVPNTAGGWFGRDAAAHVEPGNWSRVRPGLPLDAVLSRLHSEDDQQGFNCLLVLSFGRCLPTDRNVPAMLGSIPLHCVCFLHPRYHYVDFRSMVAPAANNFVEIYL